MVVTLDWIAIYSRGFTMFSFDRSSPTVQTEESLPFWVEIASQQHLKDVAELRAATYGKHLPDLGAKLREPEPADTTLGCEVFVARSKLDGSLLGTLRTHSNAFVPLPLEASIDLPERFRGTRMVETTRLCVKGSPGASLVRSALFKAMHLYCLGQEVDWMLAAARYPVDRIHDSLLFEDVNDSATYYPMAHAGGVAHRVMCLAPAVAQTKWGTKQHPLYRFAFETHHPDINIMRAKDLLFKWMTPRSTANVTYLADRVPASTEPTAFEASAPMALVA